MRNTTLGQLRVGQRAVIARILEQAAGEGLSLRLMQMGFLEGSEVEVMQEAPFFRDPFAVRVRGALIALRRNEADYIEVTL